MSEHTKGPWHEARTGNHQGLIVAEDGTNVAVAYDKKDAPILAAAPDMLAALKIVTQWFEDADPGTDGAFIRNKARDAIAKAESTKS